MSMVIRASEQSGLRPRLSSIDLSDHLDEARRVVDNAREQAKGILDEAREVARQVHAETRESGYEQGFQAGERDGRKSGFEAAHKEASERFEREHADLVADMRRVIEEIDATKIDLQLAVNERLLDFALELAKRLSFEIGAIDSRAATENLSRALPLLGSALDLTVQAHPQDIAALRAFASGVADCIARSCSVRFVEDMSIAPGGCVVTSDSTVVDARLETQAAELAALLVGSKPVAVADCESNDIELRVDS